MSTGNTLKLKPGVLYRLISCTPNGYLLRRCDEFERCVDEAEYQYLKKKGRIENPKQP